MKGVSKTSKSYLYNEDLKCEFIRQYTQKKSSVDLCLTVFSSIAPREEAWGADFCTKSTNEIRPVVENIVGFRAQSKWSRIIILRKYAEWCLNVKRYPGACDGMMKLETDALGNEKMKSQMVTTPAHLQKYLDEVFKPTSKETVGNVYRCYYWLAYGGVEEKDIPKIKCSDVDFTNMVVNYGGREFPIYREAVPAFKSAAEATAFARPAIFNRDREDEYRKRVDGDTLMRGVKSDNSDIYKLRSSLFYAKKASESDAENSLTYFRLWLSGVFYRIRQREILGETPNFDDVAIERLRVKKVPHSENKSEEDKVKKLSAEYLDEYYRWKMVFGI